MHPDLVDLGWTDEYWNRIGSAVTEEAQKGRVAAQMLPLSGPEDPSTIAVPSYALGFNPNPSAPPPDRLEVNSDPTLHLTTLAVNVQLRTTEVSDPDLNAALVMFRRAANYVARLEDLLVFGGRPFPDTLLAPPFPFSPRSVWTVKGGGTVDGLLQAYSGMGWLRRYTQISAMPPQPPPPALGEQVINAVIDSINKLDAAGQLGPYACALSPRLFAAICTPTASLVLPRDRILPFLQGPLVRASAIADGFGVVVALSANPVELLVASDIGVRFLQATEEPRYVFRVSERIALRIKEQSAIGILFP
jgi:uncharacterized linocin/CFP29 family protein